MKKILLTAIALFILQLPFASSLKAQSQQQRTTLTGKVLDAESGDPIAYATVTVATADSLMSPVNAVAADMGGSFSLIVKEPGDYKFVVSYVGYTSYIADLAITGGDKKLDMGIIKISEGTEIEGVSVVVQKPLIKVEPDKMVYSVEADPEKDYSTLAEILRKVPQLSVDAEDNVRLNGQTDYKVLVNGKNSGMMSKNFKDVIKSMPANSIKDIEVITEPSTKYESEGVGGIINIITNRKTLNGYNGRVGAGYGSFNSYSANAYISAQIGKLNLSVNYWHNGYGNPGASSFSEYINYNETDQHTTRSTTGGDGRNTNNGLSFESSYEIDTFNLITLSLWGYHGKDNFETDSDVDIFKSDGTQFRKYSTEGDMTSSWGYLSGSLDYQRTFMKPDKTFTVSYKLESDPSTQDYEYETIPAINYMPKKERSYNKATGTEHTLQIDYYDPLTKAHNIEAGVKYILRMNRSDSDEKLWDGPSYSWMEHNQRESVDLNYDQHILGVYGGYLFKNKKITAKGGFRMEGTFNTGYAKTKAKNYDFDNSNFNIVPYVNFTYMPKPTQRVRASYTQRLRRPWINQLNPYEQKSYDNENIINYGNPDLKSVISHSFSAGYSIFSNSWNIDARVSYNFSNNDIISITKANGEKIETSYYNSGENQFVRLSLSGNYRLNTVLNVYANANAGFNKVAATVFNGITSDYISNEGFNLMASLGASVTLWKEARFNGNFGYYMSPVNLQGTNRNQYYTSFGLSQRLLKQKLDLNLSVSNPFTKYQKYGSESEQAGIFRQFSESEYQSRRINFRVGYRFGQMNVQVKKARRTISNDDRDSGSSGGSTGGGGATGQ